MQDFVWLDSADGSGSSIIAFDATAQQIFNIDDQAAFTCFLESIPVSAHPASGSGFSGGWIGFFSYESYAFNPLIPIRPTHPTREPLAAFRFYETFITANATTDTYALHTKTYAQRDVVLHRLSTIAAHEGQHMESDCGLSLDLSNSSAEIVSKYAKDFSEIMEDIASGRYFEINYSFELRHKLERPAFWFEIYRRLRKKARSPMMAFLRFDHLHILSASPERFFSIRDGVIQTSPIKGTISRNDELQKDTDQKTSLLNSSKDRAELLMITDLLRNDLGRICKTGSVATDAICDVLTLPYYHHLVSHIRGNLQSNRTLFDVFCALFPGGSITGAPKISAMQRIQNLENRNRGVYTGAIGYISNNGNVDFNLAIRTLVADADSVRFAVGSGVVSDSKMESELDECWLKASAFLDLLSSDEIINKTAS